MLSPLAKAKWAHLFFDFLKETFYNTLPQTDQIFSRSLPINSREKINF